MDCERSLAETNPFLQEAERNSQTGPGDYEESERSIRGYWEMAAEFGFPVTFFIHPELASIHRELFLELKERGACLGLHLHSWKFSNGRYPSNLGAMSESDQRAVIGEALAMWRDAFGEHPRFFRPGTFSANEATFRVLAELGFVGGSMSIPGRYWSKFAADWRGAERHPHVVPVRLPGRSAPVPFVDVPLSVDVHSPGQEEGHTYFHDLRPDRDIDHRRILRNIMYDLRSERPLVRTVSVDTHNDHDFSDPDHPWAIRLRTVLAALPELAQETGQELVGATIADVYELLRWSEAWERVEQGA